LAAFIAVLSAAPTRSTEWVAFAASRGVHLGFRKMIDAREHALFHSPLRAAFIAGLRLEGGADSSGVAFAAYRGVHCGGPDIYHKTLNTCLRPPRERRSLRGNH
jgi:hypothetical protein